MYLLKRLLLVWCVVFLCALAATDTALAQKIDHYILSSGSSNGPFHQTAIEISDILNRYLTKSRIVPIISGGSADNIESLGDRMADLIICQRNILVENYFAGNNSLPNIRVILPLFPEALQIFVKGTGEVISFTEFRNRIRSGEINQFCIGSPGSPGNVTTRRLMNLLGFLDVHVYDEGTPSSVYSSRFPEEGIDAIVRFSAFPIRTMNDKLGRFDMVSFNEDELQILTSHLSGLDPISFSSSLYPEKFSRIGEVHTIGTWAFLATLSNTMEKIELKEGFSLPKVLADEILSPYYNATYLSRGLKDANHFISDPGGRISLKPVASRGPDFFRGLPLTAGLTTITGKEDQHGSNMLFLLVIVLGIATVIAWPKRRRIGEILVDYKRYFYAIAFMVLAYFIISYVIIASEQFVQNSYDINSPVLNLNTGEFHKWLLLAVLTDYYYLEIFPISTPAQIAMSLTFNLIWLNGLLFIAYEIYSRYKHYKRIKGMGIRPMKDHFVVCGWNAQAPKFIEDTYTALTQYMRKGQHGGILVVNNRLKDEFETNDLLQKMHKRKHFEYLFGEAKDVEILEKACIDQAHTVVLLADNHSRESDEKTLLRALTISSHCKQKAKETIDNIYIIAEINNSEFRAPLLEADVNEVVCTSDTGNKIITQSMMNHGLSDALDTLLTYNGHNEFYTIKMQDYPQFQGKHFNDLLWELRMYNILLFAIKAKEYTKDGKEIIDREEIQKKLKDKFGLDRAVITNPHTPEENRYKTDEDDALIVLAENEKVIEKLKHSTKHLALPKKLSERIDQSSS